MSAWRGFNRYYKVVGAEGGVGDGLRKAGADTNGSLDASQERRGMYDDTEASSLSGGNLGVLSFELDLLEDVGDVIADLSGL